jgi:enolase
LIKVKDTLFTGGKGDEGGWAPNISNYEALEFNPGLVKKYQIKQVFKSDFPLI